MNNLIYRQVGNQFNRSTNLTIARTVSTQYIPGRKGYAPGFEAPEGTRESTKVINKRRDIGHSLTSHLESNNSAKNKTPETTSAKKLYRQELKVTRHKYARELLEKQGQKELKSAEKLALTEKKNQQLKAYFEKEKEQQKQHEEQVVAMLQLDSSKGLDTGKRQEERTQQRIENRLALEEQQRNTRRKQLLKLYATTENFVTLDNLDAKIDQVMLAEGRSFHENLTELMHNTNSVQSEIESRKAQLKEAMGL